MKVLRHKHFKRQYKKLPRFLRIKTDLTIGKFYNNPFDPSLRNHALYGSMAGKRAISVTGNVRVVFEEYNNYVIVTLLDVGTHNQVY